MTTFVTVIHVVTCILLVLVVLIQSGKGAEISASFSGSSQTVFGSSGGANFFTHFTQGAAAVFFITSMTLTLLGGMNRKSLFEGAAAQNTAPTSAAPAAAAPAAAAGAAVPASGAVAAPAAAQQEAAKPAH